MNLNIIKERIKQFSSLSKDELLRELGKDASLNRDEKNAIYFWLFPPLIGDRELPGMIEK